MMAPGRFVIIGFVLICLNSNFLGMSLILQQAGEFNRH